MTGADQRMPAAVPLDWRRKLLDWLLLAAFALASVAFPVIGVQAVTFSQLFWMGVMVALYLLLVLVTFARRLPYVARALGLLTALGAVALLGFVRVGYQVGPGVGSALLVVMSGLLLGRAAMIGAFALTLFTIPAVGLYTQASQALYLASHVNDPMQLSNWWRVTAVYALFTGVLAAAVSFVVGHIERLLAQRTETLDRLRAASLLKEEAEHALDDAQRTILQMQKLDALGRLAGGVAHDFNNALVVILGYADLLRGRARADQELQRGLTEIIAAGNHAAGLTRQLLSFGRRAVSVPRALSPAQLFGEVEGMLRRVLPEHIQLSVAAASDDDCTIFADPGELQQVLLNLCMNARDAMPRGGELTLSAQRIAAPSGGALPPGEWVAITVRDTGCGMDEHTRAHAFEPFFTTKGDRGTGLGLAMVYGIIAQSGGHVRVESEPGEGASISLLLPPCAAEVTPRPQPSALPVLRPSTILVAEDETPVRELIQSAFRSAGHKVLAATDGSEALTLARRYRGEIDLLCTDGVMPGNVSSRQLIDGFRALFPRARVLVCSGHAEELALDRALLSQIKYLQKPFTVETLLRNASEALLDEGP